MHKLIEWFVKNHVAANLLMILIVFLGLRATFFSIPLEVFPSFELDTVNIRVTLPGSTPEEAEESLAVRIEEAVYDLEGIEQLISRSSEGGTTVSVEVDGLHDIRDVLADIKTRVDAINTFPADAERPVVSQAERRREVISVVLSGDLDGKELRGLGTEIREELLLLPGITQVFLESVAPFEISIEISEQTLRRYTLTMAQVAEAVKRSSVDLSGGVIKTMGGEILLRSKGQAYSTEEFAAIAIRTTKDGTRLLLGDIADIRDGFDQTPIKVRFNKQNALLIEVYRIGEQNAIQVAKQIRSYIKTKAEVLPSGVHITYWKDRSRIVKARLQTLANSAMQGGVLVAILLSLFLRPAIAFWVCVGIPVSFLGGLWIMPFQGGTDPLEAAITGTKEVSIPVTFGVLTTMAAFYPLTMIEGVRGQIFGQIPAIVIPVLFFSLVESKLILPAHLKHLKRQKQDSLGFFSRLQQSIANGFEQAVFRFYRPFLDRCLRNPLNTLALAMAVLIIVFSVVFSGWTRFVFFPRVPSETVRLKLTMPAGTAFHITDNAIEHIVSQAVKLKEKYRDPASGKSVIRNILSTTGSSGGSAAGQPNKGRVLLELEPPETRLISIKSTSLVKEWRKMIGPVAGMESLTMRAEIGRGGSPVDIQLTGQEFSQLKQVAAGVKQKLAEYPAVFDIEDSLSRGKQELQLQIKPQAQALGLSLSDLARQVRQAFFGYEVQRILRGRDDVRVYIRYPEEERNSLYNLDAMLVRTADGTEIPFIEVADLIASQSPSRITRIDQRRSLSITADVDKQNADIEAIKREVIQFMDEILLRFPAIRYTIEGEAKEQRQSFQGLKSGLILVLFIIFGLLAIPFRSYWQPLIVMSMIPFGAVGAIGGHWLMGKPLTIMSLMGMLALTGVVVNDSLVLVDFINRKRREGVALQEAVSQAGVARFRAVVLTSLTTFAGLAPLIFEKSTQAQFLIPMAISLGFGIVFATICTLVLLPVNYLLFTRTGQLLGRWLR